MSLREIVEGSDTLAGRAFDVVVTLLVLCSLASFSIETLPDLSPPAVELLDRIELVIIALFSIEYLLRIWVAERRLAYVFSFFGLIDLLAILPFYLALGLDLRSIRIVRILRIFQIFKLVRYSQATRRIVRALQIAREELVLFGLVALVTLYGAAVGIYYFERDAQPEKFASVFHSMWWAVATLTTVGYGDVFPVTTGGRVFTFALLRVGLGIIAVPAGVVASALSKARELDDRESQGEIT